MFWEMFPKELSQGAKVWTLNQWKSQEWTSKQNTPGFKFQCFKTTREILRYLKRFSGLKGIGLLAPFIFYLREDTNNKCDAFTLIESIQECMKSDGMGKKRGSSKSDFISYGALTKHLMMRKGGKRLKIIWHPKLTTPILDRLKTLSKTLK